MNTQSLTHSLTRSLTTRPLPSSPSSPSSPSGRCTKRSYGMSVTTLDEVFLRVAEGTMDFAGQKHLLDANGNGNSNGNCSVNVDSKGGSAGLATTTASHTQRNQGGPSSMTAAQQHAKVHIAVGW